MREFPKTRGTLFWGPYNLRKLPCCDRAREGLQGDMVPVPERTFGPSKARPKIALTKEILLLTIPTSVFFSGLVSPTTRRTLGALNIRGREQWG